MAEAVAGPGAAPTVAAEEVGDLYAALAARLRQIVGAKLQASDQVLEDACQFAWGRLVNHRDRVHRDTALGWLVITARREAIRLIRCQHRELSLDELGEGVAPRRPLATPTDELVEQRARLASVGRLPTRQQRLVWLQGLGFSYGEMADLEGATLRTVERQLLRAKKTLRSAA